MAAKRPPRVAENIRGMRQEHVRPADVHAGQRGGWARSRDASRLLPAAAFLSPSQLVIEAASDVAESVLYLVPKRDYRPRRAIAVARSAARYGLLGTVEGLRQAAAEAYAASDDLVDGDEAAALAALAAANVANGVAYLATAATAMAEADAAAGERDARTAAAYEDAAVRAVRAAGASFSMVAADAAHAEARAHGGRFMDARYRAAMARLADLVRARIPRPSGSARRG